MSVTTPPAVAYRKKSAATLRHGSCISPLDGGEVKSHLPAGAESKSRNKCKELV
jgi:hypothetical protein